MGELGTAASAAVVGEKIEQLNFSIATLRKQGACEIADPQSLGFAIALGLEQNKVRVGLSVLLALVVQSICCFGLLVIMGGHGGSGAADRAPVEPTTPEWIGKWLTDRADPDPTARVSFRTWRRTVGSGVGDGGCAARFAQIQAPLADGLRRVGVGRRGTVCRGSAHLPREYNVRSIGNAVRWQWGTYPPAVGGMLVERIGGFDFGSGLDRQQLKELLQTQFLVSLQP